VTVWVIGVDITRVDATRTIFVHTFVAVFAGFRFPAIIVPFARFHAISVTIFLRTDWIMGVGDAKFETFSIINFTYFICIYSRARGLSITPQVADAPLVVIFDIDAIWCFISDDITLIGVAPLLNEVLRCHIVRTIVRKAGPVVCATHTTHITCMKPEFSQKTGEEELSIC